MKFDSEELKYELFASQERCKRCTRHKKSTSTRVCHCSLHLLKRFINVPFSASTLHLRCVLDRATHTVLGQPSLLIQLAVREVAVKASVYAATCPA